MAYGRLIGCIHRLSKMYQPTNPAWRRPVWDDATMQYAHFYLSEGQTAVNHCYEELMLSLRSLPVEQEGYGMIHQDPHAGNFFVDGNYQITLFDFDDCVYGHFAYDIAMVMFYAIINHSDPKRLLMEFWPVFMRGYMEENSLSSAWLTKIPQFMKLREIDLYAVCFGMYGREPSGNVWIDTFMNDRQKLIVDRPYIDFDFSLN